MGNPYEWSKSTIANGRWTLIRLCCPTCANKFNPWFPALTRRSGVVETKGISTYLHTPGVIPGAI